LKTEKIRAVFKRVETLMQDISDYNQTPAETFEAGHQIKNYL
jgi:hypothetical protein